MKPLHTLFADANYSLDKISLPVAEITSVVEKFFSEYFQIEWGINVIITNSLPWLIIPEDGVGGKTYASDFVVLSIDQQNTTPAAISEMLVHELAHAIRWGKNPEWSKNLFCELVSEGLALHLEAEFVKTQSKKTFFLEKILNHNDAENRAMFGRLKLEFVAERYDYDAIFFGNHQWPRWAGYSVGYYIVKEYLARTGKSVFDAIEDSYEDFRAHTT